MAYDSRTALIVVDVQNDFADPDGSLYVVGGEEAIQAINSEVHEASAAGSVVVYTKDWHPPSTPHFAKDGGVWPVHCVGGMPGSEFHPSLDVVEDAHHVRKGVGGEDGYSAFGVRDPSTGDRTSTGLDQFLSEAGVTRVVVVGLALDYCVKDTALDAAEAGFETTVLADCTRAVNLEPGDGARAVAALVTEGIEVR